MDQETRVALSGIVGAAGIILFAILVMAIGLAATLTLLAILSFCLLGGYLSWKHRKRIVAYLAEVQRQRALAAKERATRPRSSSVLGRTGWGHGLRGSFPNQVTFLGPGAILETDRGYIQDPLVYAVAGEADWMTEPSLIESRLAVAPPGSTCLRELPYWPSYREASPQQRAVYLDWLLGGRKAMPPQVGYVFIYFYGLERRALSEQTDHLAVIDEVMRLRSLNDNDDEQRPNWSFERYTCSFLWFLAAAYPDAFDEPRMRRLAMSTKSWDDDSLSSFLAWFLQAKRPVPAWAGYYVAGQQPDAQNSVVVTRVGREFKKLFKQRYREQYGNGLDLRASKRERRYVYATASAVIGEAALTGPNPLGLRSQFKGLVELWNSCVEDLRKLSSAVRKEGKAALTVAKWEALPPELRGSTTHPLTDEICSLVSEAVDDQGRTFVQASRVAALLEIQRRERLTPTQSRSMARTLEHVGYCLEPDARLTDQGYVWDERLTVFLRLHEDEPVASRYRAGSCILRLGMYVAASDGHVDPEELETMSREIERMFDLNAHEHRRMAALQSLLLTCEPDTKGLSRLTKNIKPEYRQAIGKLLLVLVATDGVVTKEEIRAVSKCYRTLGFKKEEIDAALDSLRAYQSGQPVTVRPGTQIAAGEKIPPPLVEEIKLDREAIGRIIEDTRQVANMLAEAMAVDEEPETQSHVEVASAIVETAAPTTTEPQTMGSEDVELPQRYAQFYRFLISRDDWNLQEVDSVARQHGLMLSGAVEAINEWATEKYGGQLFIEDGSRLIVEQEYLN